MRSAYPAAGERPRLAVSRLAGRRRVASDDGRVRADLNGLVVRVDGRAEPCHTTAEAVGGYVLVIGSVVPSHALTLASTYLFSLGRSETAVSHLCLAPGRPEQFAQRRLGPLVGQTHPRACLLEHALELQTVLGELFDEDVLVDVEDQLLDAAATVWRRR